MLLTSPFFLFFNECFFEIILGLGIALIMFLDGVIKYLTKLLHEEDFVFRL